MIHQDCDSSVDTADFCWCLVISMEELCKCEILIILDGFSHDSARVVTTNKLHIVLNDEDQVDTQAELRAQLGCGI